jgi:hypothetical protein
MAKFSLTSKALNLLGSFFIGTPESLKMPPDFFAEKGDRAVPTVSGMQQFKTQRDRLTIDAVRRGLFLRVGVLTTIASLALAMGSLFIVGTVAAGHREFNKLTASDTATPSTNTYGVH